MNAMPVNRFTQRLALAALALAATVDVAHACPRSGWFYDAADTPACAELSYVTTHALELTNACAQSITLTAEGCPSCSLPSVIAPGGVGTLTLDEQPEDGTLVEVDWMSGDTSGSIAFEFELNACLDGRGCAAAPHGAGGVVWGLGLALGTALVRPRRRR